MKQVQLVKSYPKLPSLCVSGDGVIPKSEEGGNREVMIVIHDIGLVYRECSFDEAVDTEPLTVEMDPIDYWKKK